VLWQASIERVDRMQNVRLGEMFIACRDALLDAMVRTGQAKPKGSWRLPSYMRSSAPQEERTPATRDAALVKLGRLIPGLVRGVPPGKADES